MPSTVAWALQMSDPPSTPIACNRHSMYSPNPKQIYYHSKNSAGIAYLARWRIIIDLGGKWTIDNSSCPWTQYCTRIIDMLFLERVGVQSIYAGPSQTFQVPSHSCRYGKTWKVKSIFKRYSMKCNHPNFILSCATLRSFTSLWK